MLKFKKFAMQPNIINCHGSLASIPKINFKKKESSQNWTKWGENTALFIQFGIIFVKKASSRLISEHFYDTCDTFFKSSPLGDIRPKIQK